MARPDMPAIEAWTPLPHDPPCDRELVCVDDDHVPDLARLPNEDGGVISVGYYLPGGCQFSQPTFGISVEWDDGGCTPVTFTIGDTITLVTAANQFLEECRRKYELTGVVDTRPPVPPAPALQPRRPWWRRQIARAAQRFI